MSTQLEAPPRTRGHVGRRLVPAVVLLAVLVVATVWWRAGASGASDSTVPYEDPRSAGEITLCSADGEPVTGGSTDQSPFVPVVVGETALPEGVGPAGAVGTLFAYQPRAGITAGEFSGAVLSAAGLLADPGQPAVAVQEGSWSLADFTTAFPADLDGFVQLRLYLGTPEVGTLTDQPYDTADLRVDGDRWELVSGGTASCADHQTTEENR